MQDTWCEGWGPKLLVAALTLGALAVSERPAKAQPLTQVICPSYCALAIRKPAYSIPEGAFDRVTTVLRVRLSETGHIENVVLDI